MEDFRGQHVDRNLLHVCSQHFALDRFGGGRLADALYRHLSTFGPSGFHSLVCTRIGEVSNYPSPIVPYVHHFVVALFRWLVSQGKVEEAVTILRKFEKWNGSKVDEKIYKKFIVSSFGGVLQKIAPISRSDFFETQNQEGHCWIL